MTTTRPQANKLTQHAAIVFLSPYVLRCFFFLWDIRKQERPNQPTCPTTTPTTSQRPLLLLQLTICSWTTPVLFQPFCFSWPHFIVNHCFLYTTHLFYFGQHKFTSNSISYFWIYDVSKHKCYAKTRVCQTLENARLSKHGPTNRSTIQKRYHLLKVFGAIREGVEIKARKWLQTNRKTKIGRIEGIVPSL